MKKDNYKPSDESVKKVQEFEAADRDFREAWNKFEQSYAAEFKYMDDLREKRNASLDAARRCVRAEAEELDPTLVKSFKVGPLSVVKPWSDFYNGDKFVARLRLKNLYDMAKSAGIIAEKIEIAKYEEARQFLKAHNLEKEFEDCEDGKSLSPTITGPKPIPAFGIDYKEAK